jgi:hypothetical protein
LYCVVGNNSLQLAFFKIKKPVALDLVLFGESGMEGVCRPGAHAFAFVVKPV